MEGRPAARAQIERKLAQVADLKRLSARHGLRNDGPVAARVIPFEAKQGGAGPCRDIDRGRQRVLGGVACEMSPKDTLEPLHIPPAGRISPRLGIAEITEVNIIKPGVFEYLGETFFREAGLAGVRNIADVDEHLDIGELQRRDEITDRRTFVTNCQQCPQRTLLLL